MPRTTHWAWTKWTPGIHTPVPGQQLRGNQGAVEGGLLAVPEAPLTPRLTTLSNRSGESG